MINDNVMKFSFGNVFFLVSDDKSHETCQLWISRAARPAFGLRVNFVFADL